MSVNVTPRGSRGQQRPPGPIMWLINKVTRASHRLGGKRMDGQPVILLTTRGARSGQLRTSPVISFPQGDSAWLVVASFAGSVEHPAWFINMARHPDDTWIEVDGRRTRVAPASLTGEEREQAWATITAKSPRFIEYQKKTDRELPVIRLTAAPG